MTTPRRHATVPRKWHSIDAQMFRVASAVNGVLSGRSNNHFILTLDPSATETVLESELVTPQTSAFFSPRSASAAATQLWYSIATGKVTFHHDASTDTDRSFAVLLVG